MIHKLSEPVPDAGVYRCTSCGHAETFERGEEFPECEKCFREEDTGWELVVGEPLGPAGGVEV